MFRVYTPTTNKVQLIAPMQQSMNIPWADNAAAVAVLMGNDPAASKGVANGYASLDSNGLVPKHRSTGALLATWEHNSGSRNIYRAEVPELCGHAMRGYISGS